MVIRISPCHSDLRAWFSGACWGGLVAMNMEYDFHICSIGEFRHVKTTSESWLYRDTLAVIFLYDSLVVRMPKSRAVLLLGKLRTSVISCWTGEENALIKTSNYAPSTEGTILYWIFGIGLNGRSWPLEEPWCKFTLLRKMTLTEVT